MRLHTIHGQYLTTHGDELPRPPTAFGCLLALAMAGIAAGAVATAIWLIGHDPGPLAWSLMVVTAIPFGLMGAGIRRW